MATITITGGEPTITGATDENGGTYIIVTGPRGTVFVTANDTETVHTVRHTEAIEGVTTDNAGDALDLALEMAGACI